MPIFVLQDQITNDLRSDCMAPLCARQFPREEVEKLDERVQLLDVDLLELDQLVSVRRRTVALQANAAALGGAVHVSSFSAPEGPAFVPSLQFETGLLIENSTFLNNIATEAGGGLHVDEVPTTLIDCTFQGNHAGQLGGGADFLHADQRLTRCRFESNNALNGGGVSWSGFGVMSMDQVVFQSNLAQNFGGGLWTMSATQVLLDHTWFLENHADRGGGAYLSHVMGRGSHCLWRGNTAVARGRFNDSAQSYNTVLKKFPTNLIAGMLGFKERPFFKATTPVNQVSGGATATVEHLSRASFYFRKAEFDFLLREESL
jgi:hypothetical protein